MISSTPTRASVPTGTSRPARAGTWGALASSWCLRLTSLAAFLGVVVGTVGQVAIVTLGRSTPTVALAPTLWQRVIGVAVTAFAYALIGLVVSLISASWLRLRWGKMLGGTLFTLVFTLAFAANVLSTVIRILSGTHITIGAIEFIMSSPEHFRHAAFEGYAWSVRMVLFAVVLFALATAVRTTSTLRAPGAPRFRSITALVTVLLLSVVGGVGSARATLDPGVYGSTAELAFAHSMGTSSGLREVAKSAGSSTGSFAGSASALGPEPGPPRSAEKLWEMAVAHAEGPRPNILILTLESVSYRHLGYEGYGRGVTPNLDALAEEGLRFHRAWATATHSNYAQMAILSSLFPRRGTQLDMYFKLDYPRLLPHDFFHRLGYATATISSQDERWQGMRRFENTGTPTYYWNAPDHKGPFIDTGTERIVPDELTVQNIKRWVDRNKTGPWELYVNFQCTHFPYKLPAHAARPFRPETPNPNTFTYLRYPEAEVDVVKNRYDNALAYVDRQIGRLRNYLHATGQYDNTLWVITSDHGEMFFQHGMVTHGKTLYDAESRVPLILHWPQGIAPGDVDDPVSHLDIMPTIADLLHLPAHPSYQGTSLLHRTQERRAAVFMNIQGLRFAEAVVCYPWKLMYDATAREAFVFNLDRDPGELHNLVQEEPNVAAALAALLQAQIDAQLWYHEGDDGERDRRFQPRLGVCPDLPR